MINSMGQNWDRRVVITVSVLALFDLIPLLALMVYLILASIAVVSSALLILCMSNLSHFFLP